MRLGRCAKEGLQQVQGLLGVALALAQDVVHGVDVQAGEGGVQLQRADLARDLLQHRGQRLLPKSYRCEVPAQTTALVEGLESHLELIEWGRRFQAADPQVLVCC